MRMPEGWDNNSSKVSKIVSKKVVTAGGTDMSPEVAGKGLCPACKKPMQKMFANNEPVLCCLEDRIVLPIKD